jgi:MYXO-CTERM domain-containing protein
MRAASVLGVVLFATAWARSESVAAPVAEWQAMPAMSSARDLATATALDTGGVLVVGGESAGSFLATAERFDPPTGAWSAASSLDAGRDQHVAVLLGDGRVLCAGGYGDGKYLASAALYDPTGDAWTATAPMNAGRLGATGTVLGDGAVLLAGGYNDNGLTAAAELFDPSTGVWTVTGSMAAPRNRHTATRLSDGRVLVAGGFDGTAGIAGAELFDPASGTWSAAAPMTTPRWFHVAIGLADGRVLVAGGHGGTAALASAEIYDPALDAWTDAGTMGAPRFGATATAWDGGVLVAGGSDGQRALGSVEGFDPATETFSPLPSMQHPRYQHVAAALADGAVLVAGGLDDEGALASAELFGGEPCAACGGGGAGGGAAGGDGDAGDPSGGCACSLGDAPPRAPWVAVAIAGALALLRKRARLARSLAAFACGVVAGCGAPPVSSPAPEGVVVEGYVVHCTEHLPAFCRKACDAGDGPACRTLAVALRDHAAPRDEYGTLVDRLRQAANSGVPLAYLDLARLYATGGVFGNPATGVERVEVDRPLASSYARMGCDRGLGAACYQLGLLLESDAEPDLPRSIVAYRAAAEQGEPMGWAALARRAAEQSAEIPSPDTKCTDPVVGVWLGQVYAPKRGEWYEFRLAVGRDGPTKLSGQIDVDHWVGPIVTRDREHVRMRAAGELAPDAPRKLRFDGVEFLDATPMYVLDKFRGDLEENVFSAVDEDGTNLLLPGNGRVAFIRSACDAPPAQP